MLFSARSKAWQCENTSSPISELEQVKTGRIHYLNSLSISSLVWHPLLCISLYQSYCCINNIRDNNFGTKYFTLQYNTFLYLISGCVFIIAYPECFLLKLFHKQCINILYATVILFLVFVQDFGLKNFLSICRETKVLWWYVFTSTTLISVWSTLT